MQAGTIARRVLAFLGTALGLTLAVVGCDGDNLGTRVTNHVPSVRLTGAVSPGDTLAYRAEFHWLGWDDDGVIDHYQYAVDIPVSFTPAQIDDPDPTGIAWHETPLFHAWFQFSVSRADTTVRPDGTPVALGQWSAAHTLHVRAVDNEGAVSRAAGVEFNASTLIPRTTITLPRVVPGGTGVLTVGRHVRIGWEGRDPDGTDEALHPRFYEWKLIPVTSLFTVGDAAYVVNEEPGPRTPWTRVGADTTSVILNLNTPKQYVFAVRAIDEAGAREDRFDFARNALKLQASGGRFVGRPSLTIREPLLGTNAFPADGDIVDFEVATNQKLHFDFTADAQSYGGVIQGYNWGIDVADATADGPGSNFRGWSLLPYTTEPIAFPAAGIHVVTVKCRDTSGGETIAQYRLNVLAFTFDREVLHVDDFYLTRDLFTSDDTLDARNLALLNGAGYADVRTYDAWGRGDVDAAVSPPRLSELGRYRLVYWFVKGSGGGSQPNVTALLGASVCGRLLRHYLSAGGSLWINGQFVFASLKRNPAAGLCVTTTTYDENLGLNFTPGDFVCDYLHLCGGEFRNAKSAQKTRGLVQAIPNPKYAAEGWPVVPVDSTTSPAAALGGLQFYDAMFQPTYYPPGGLDTLYTAQTTQSTSSFNRKPIAWRYAPPVPAPGLPGPVAVFGFPLAYMKQGSAGRGTGAQGLALAMARWFRSHQAGGAGRPAP